MAVVIDEVHATTVEPQAAEPAAAPAQGSDFDPEKVRALLRRDAQRQARLTVD
jgi:hypothetical protein